MPSYGAEAPRVEVRPSLVRLEPGAVQAFRLVALPQPETPAKLFEGGVRWTVNGAAGGSDAAGTIDEEGRYVAPENVPGPVEIIVRAELAGAENRYAWATVLMGGPGPLYGPVQQITEPVERFYNEAKGEWDYRATGKFQMPHGVNIADDGTLLLADMGANKVYRFTKDGEYLGEWGGGPGQDPGKFENPRFAVPDGQGNVYVSDTRNEGDRIQVFTADGAYLSSFAPPGSAPGAITRCHGMGFDLEKQLIAVDVDNNRVNVYSHEGGFLYDFGEPGRYLDEFNVPHGLDVDPNGDAFVSCYFTPCFKTTAQGGLLKAFGEGEPGIGHTFIHSVHTDAQGNVYLTVRGGEDASVDAGRFTGGTAEAVAKDAEGRRMSLLKYNNSGDFITGIALAEPTSVATWVAIDEDGRLYVTTFGDERIGFEILAPAHRPGSEE
jgi:DNA-binding beta-propeller fold protein YncE